MNQTRFAASNIRQNPTKFTYNITQKQIYTIHNSINLSLVKHLLSQETQPNIIKINDPVIIVGDIHGQYYDLIKVLALFGEEKISSEKYIDVNSRKQTSFVFLGDYVDRGIMAIQVMSLLMLFKISNPNKVIMLRGNHQSRIMAELYNFKQQCNEKYGQGIYELFMDAFDSLPLGCIINQKYLCVHGGITDKLKTLSYNLMQINDIQKIQRTIEIPLTGAYCDLIWSDPTPNANGKMKNKTLFNESRDCSIYFGYQLAQQFLKQNNLLSIIRGHQVFQQGYKSYNWANKQIPQALTIFSAPNYCNSYGNRGAVMRIQNDRIKIRQYSQQVPQRLKLIQKLEVFPWSLDKILDYTNGFVKCMMERISQLYIEQLVDQDHSKMLEAFLGYQKQKQNPTFSTKITNFLTGSSTFYNVQHNTNNKDNSLSQSRYSEQSQWQSVYNNKHNPNQKPQPQTNIFSFKPSNQKATKFSIKQYQQQQQHRTNPNDQNGFKIQEQKKQYLFKRSQQYYRQSHKIPKHNKFKGSNFQEYKIMKQNG